MVSYGVAPFEVGSVSPAEFPGDSPKFVFISICILFNVKAAAHSRTNQWTKT